MNFSAFRLWFRRRWFWKARHLAAGAVLGGVVLALVPLGPLDRFVFDLTSVLAACADDARPPVDITIVELDSGSKKQLGQPPDAALDRKFYAQAVRRLRQEGARVVVFDLLFPEPARDPSEDADFAAALREHGGVVLPAEVIQVNDRTQQTLSPCPVLMAAAVWGSASVLTDPDLVVRRPAVNPEAAPALAARATQLLGGTPPVDYETNQATPPGRFLRWPAPGSFPRLDFTNLIQQAGPLGLSNRVVILGSRPGARLPGASCDTFGSPWTRFGRGLVSGPTVHAVVLANYASGGWINESSPAARAPWGAAWGLAAALAAWWLGGRRPFLMWCVPLVFPFLGLFLSTFFFARFQVWLPWFAPAILVPLAVAIRLWRTPVPRPIDVFISYRRKPDGPHAALLHLALLHRNLAVFYAPESLPPGPFPARLQRAVENSRGLAVIFSPETFSAETAVRRDYVMEEIAAARSAGVEIIPVIRGFEEPVTQHHWPKELAAVEFLQDHTVIRYDDPESAAGVAEQIATRLQALDPED